VSRAFKFTLLIGIQVSVILGVIFITGWLRPLDAVVERILGLDAQAPTHPFWQCLAFMGVACGIAWTTIDINRPAFKMLVAALTIAEVFTFAALLALYGVYFSPILPMAAVLMAFAAGFSYSRSQTGQRQRLVDWAFGPRVSRRQTRALVDGRAAIEPEGQLEELTLVVCEIFNHQRLMEALEPSAYAAISNRFANCAAEILVEKGGTLAACDGEGVRVIFGAPLPLASHAAAACRAALEVARQTKTLNVECAREHAGVTCDLRIGINSGEMAVGHFGSRRLGGFGVAGEEVAFARRLCAANLIYGSTILLGARTFELAEAAIEARPLELLRRRLGDNWLEVYELLAEPHQLSPEDLARRDLFWTGVIFYREKRLHDALEKFLQARQGAPQPDGPLDFYIQRIRQLQQSKTTTDWETAHLLNSL
jgi:class 3 adenylate cyclase